MRVREKRHRANLIALFGLSLIVSVLGGLGVVVVIKRPPPPGVADSNFAEQARLGSYLADHAAELNQPAGTDTTSIPFTVQPGEALTSIGNRLAAAGLVRDVQLFVYYLRYYHLDAQIKPGVVLLWQTMTISQIAEALTQASAREVFVRLSPGERLEQIAQGLSANPQLAVSKAEFLSLAGPSGYSFLEVIPTGASLEGFLFPDTYRFNRGATALEVITQMLTNFKTQLPEAYGATVARRGLTVYQAITLASLIERETAASDERPVIASVMLNRLAAGKLLEIDATVQYALGTPENWWPGVLGVDLRAIDHPYNTYRVNRLPPGLIANPSLDSILAVAQAADTHYLYYRVKCDGSGHHVFSVTFEEHLAAC
jgi:UPF0755 protein